MNGPGRGTTADAVVDADGALGGFLERALATFEAVRSRRGDGGEVRIHIDGNAVCLRFADGRFRARLSPPLEHLEMRGGMTGTALTVHAWEGDTREAPMPPPPWSSVAYGPRGELRGLGAGRFRAAYQQTREGVGALSVLDVEGARALYWLREPGDLPEHELGAPLKAVFQWWLSLRGYGLLHAAAVGYPDTAVLLAGKGGSGKSTAAMTCLSSGMSYLGDDYCLVRGGGEPRVFSLYSTGKLHPGTLERFPALKPVFGDRGIPCDDKLLVHLHRLCPGRIGLAARVRAIALPRIRPGGGTTLQPATPAEALLALAPSTMFQLGGPGKDVFQMASRLVRTVPAYWLHLGDDMSAVPGLIGLAACTGAEKGR